MFFILFFGAGLMICKAHDGSLSLPSSAKLWCKLAGPDYRAAYRRIEIIKRSDRLFPTQIRKLEISTGIVAPPPKWRTIDLGATKTDHLPHVLTAGAIPRDEVVEYLRKHQIVQGPWAEPFDGSLMRRRYGPDDKDRPTSYPVGHRGHVASDQFVTGCLACIKTWAVNSQIQVLERKKATSEAELAKCNRMYYAERGSLYGSPWHYRKRIMKLESEIRRTCMEMKRLGVPELDSASAGMVESGT